MPKESLALPRLRPKAATIEARSLAQIQNQKACFGYKGLVCKRPGPPEEERKTKQTEKPHPKNTRRASQRSLQFALEMRFSQRCRASLNVTLGCPQRGRAFGLRIAREEPNSLATTVAVGYSNPAAGE